MQHKPTLAFIAKLLELVHAEQAGIRDDLLVTMERVTLLTAEVRALRKVPRQAKRKNNLLTLQEVQEALQCGRRKVYMLGAQGRLDLVKFDRSTRVTRLSVDRLMNKIAAKSYRSKGGRTVVVIKAKRS